MLYHILEKNFSLASILSIVTSAIFLVNCTGLKKVSTEDPLLDKTDIVFESRLVSADKQELKYELEDVIIPKPNSRFLWMRPGVAIHSMVGKVKKEKGVKHWIKNSLGSPPVTLGEVYPENIKEALQNRMFNYGYFNAEIEHEIISKGRKTADVIYTIDPGEIFRFDSVRYPLVKNRLSEVIKASKSGSLVLPGNPYNLNILIRDRERIEADLKDLGYFYFRSDHLIFRADTFSLENRVLMNLRIKPDIPPEADKIMNIGQVYIHDDFRIDDYYPDTIQINKKKYISQTHNIRPEIILDKIYLNSGETYSRALHYRTVNHLSGFGIYRYISVDFREDKVNHLLDTYIYMTPLKRNSISAEINTVARTTNYVGPGINLSWRNRNIFKGGETFTMNLSGSFEVQVGADSINTAYEIGLDAGLEIPRLIPFHIGNVSLEYIPVTTIKTGANLYRRVELYALRSFYLNLGYLWRQSSVLRHDLRVFDISFTNLTDQTDAFRDYLENNPIVRRSFEEQFILGTSYSITYDRLNSVERTNIFLNGTIESAGNSLSLISNIANDPESINDFFGVPYSQFFKIKGEYRHYFSVGRENKLATRAIIGVGIPYGNSEILPYIRQFFAGGTNSIRAFISRSVGPGSYRPPVENLGIDQTGDLKLEANMEYRHSFSRLFKGAIFVDAGNVWLKNPDPERPGADFESNRFWKEIALGSGIGFRIDAEFVVFRLDFAFKMFDPSLPQGERWVLNDFNPLSSEWRKNNFLLNIAIGYPF